MKALFAALAFVAAGPSPTNAQGAGPPILLSPSTPAEEGIRGGGLVHLAIAATASDLVDVTVEQLGVDVVVTLRSPDGNVVAEVDNEDDPFLPERLLAVADAAGTYRLDLKTRWIDAQPGRFRAALAMPHGATEGDRICAAAARDLDEGRRLMRQELPSLLPAAMSKVEASAAGFKACGDARFEATAHFAGADAQRTEAGPTALERSERALRVARALGDRTMEARVLALIAYQQEMKGEPESARANADAAVRLSRETGDRFLEGRCLATLGVILDRRGALEEALDVYRDALALSEAVDDRRTAAAVLNNMGNALDDVGDAQSAVDVQTRAIGQARAAGFFTLQAMAESNLGNRYKKAGENAKALEHYAASLDLARRIGSRRAESQALNNMGQIHRRMGDPRKALDLHEQSLAIRKAGGDRAGEAAALDSLGRAWAALGDVDRAIAYYKEALQIRKDIRMPILQSDTLLQMARAERDRGRLAEARRFVESGLEVVESVRAEVKSAEYRASYRASEEELYDFYVQLLMQMSDAQPRAGHDVEAFNASEMGRSRVLLESLVEDRAPEPRQKPVAIDVRQIQADVVDGDTVLIEYAMGQERSTVWAVTSRSIESHRLPARSVIEGSARRVHALVSKPPGGESMTDLNRELAALGETILGPLAGQLRREWKGKRLLFVADGALQYVPMPSLSIPASNGAGNAVPLLDDHEVISGPSASVVAAVRRETALRPTAPRAVAVVADPVFERSDPRVKRAAGRTHVAAERTASLRSAPEGRDEPGLRRGQRQLERMLRSAGLSPGVASLPRLPFSREEAKEILALAPKNASFEVIDFRATRDVVLTDDLATSRIVHFATHGLLNASHPDLSGLVFSLVDEAGRPRNGVLSAGDVSGLRLGADLVVLSACQTALGKEIKGEGLVGLTRAFMRAGARAVVASLWRVDDLATAELMKRFYGHMLRDRQAPTAALRSAQLEMARSKRWSAPFYWAGFVIQGDWITKAQ